MSEKEKKKKLQTVSLGEFLSGDVGSWALSTGDDAFQLPSAPASPEIVHEIDHSRLPTKPPFTLYIGNLPFGATEEDIRSLLKNYELLRVTIPKSAGGKSKGYGYVDFDSAESLKKAISLNGALSIEGRIVRLDAAETKAPRREWTSRGDSTSEILSGPKRGPRDLEGWRTRHSEIPKPQPRLDWESLRTRSKLVRPVPQPKPRAELDQPWRIIK